MVLDTDLAARNSVIFKNKSFKAGVSVKIRKGLIIANYDPSLTEVVADLPTQVFNAREVGARLGNGYMAHSLAKRWYDGSLGNVETWIIPQAEAGGAVAAAGNIDFTGTVLTKAGTLSLYIAGVGIQIPLASGADDEAVVDAIVAAIPDSSDFPVKVIDNAGIVDLTAKTKGPWGNDITIAFNLKAGESLPDGLVYIITDMTGGVGTPDVQTALDALGTGDNQNEDDFTDVICGYGFDTDTLDKISAYNGESENNTGNYKGEVQRPWRSLVGDTTSGTAGLTALIVKTDLRAENDMTNGVYASPGSYHHPMELAAVALGIMARKNSVRAEEPYFDEPLPGVIPAPSIDRWTNNVENRELAVKSGISTSWVKNGQETLQNIITFWRPGALPPESNAWRSMRNVSITQNVGVNVFNRFELEQFKNLSIVADKAKVTNLTSQQKVIDVDEIRAELVDLVKGFEGKAWIYNAAWTISKFNEITPVAIRANGSGFDLVLPLIYSGEGGIYNTEIQIDTNLSVVNT